MHASPAGFDLRSRAASLSVGIMPTTKTAKKNTPEQLTVADVARELGVDPKKARAALRATGMRASKGKWPAFRRGGQLHRQVLAATTGESASVVLTQKPAK
jgi:hypothetical protein